MTASENGIVTGARRLEFAFASARAAGRGALVPFVSTGDPSLEATAAVLASLAEAGVDAIEIGIPYGDPLADGPTIAGASQRSLARGTRMRDVLALVRDAARHPRMPPLIAFTYANPVMQYGLERFAAAFAEAGGSAALVPDLPIEEAAPIREAFGASGIGLAQLVAPTTPLERAVRIAETSDGFVYLVSRLGVTSATNEPDLTWTQERVTALRARTTLPILVGFGVATAAHVRAIVRHADGVIVGSALVAEIARASSAEDAAARARRFIEPLVGATGRI